MKILLLAPQPFYQERGTPIAVDLLLRALSARGDTVDALVYAEGADVSYPGVTLRRLPDLRWLRGIGPGPSLKKIACDLVFVAAAWRLARRGRYDVIHAVEESAYMARLLGRVVGTPYVYDMDSSIADQLVEKYPWLRGLRGLFRAIEASVVRRAELVLPVCEALADCARRYGATRVTVLHDVSLLRDDASPDRASHPLLDGHTVVMYIGNLEHYQGIDLLIESFAIASPHIRQARLAIIGGQPAHIARYRLMAQRLRIGDRVQFLGPQPVRRLGAWMRAADVLVSPRIKGGNTPMKIYSYLHSGKAVLATALPTHTQVLTDEVALLAPASPEPLAEALVRLVRDPALRRRLGAAARALVERQHTTAVFRRVLGECYDALERRLMAADRQIPQPVPMRQQLEVASR